MAGVGLTGFLQNLSGGEMIVILIVALVVLGPERLPELARGAGRAIHKLKSMTEGLQSEVRDVMDDPSMQPLKELGEFAARPRQKLTEYALEAEAEERSRKEAAAHAAHEAAVAEADASDAGDAGDAGDQNDANQEHTDGAAEPLVPDDSDDAEIDTSSTSSRLGPLVAAVEREAARARAAQESAPDPGAGPDTADDQEPT